jgi:hypothetical protein
MTLFPDIQSRLAMRAPEFAFRSAAKLFLYLRKSITEFTTNLGAFFPIVVIQILRRRFTEETTTVIGNFLRRAAMLDRLERATVLLVVSL